MLSILTLILIVSTAYAVSFGGNMVFHYCTKDKHVKSGHYDWPRGNYCILRRGISCPRGFRTGSINWDDEDSRNANALGGVLPNGSYGRNTLINYCCRSDGLARKRIALHKNKPFYLLRFRSPCQQGKGMHGREEIVHSDDEDSRNKNRSTGSHPLNDGGRNNRLFYCYYH